MQRRYDDLEAAPPVDYIHELLFFLKSFEYVLLPTTSPNGFYCLSVRMLAENLASICVPSVFGVLPLFFPTACVDLSVGKYLLVIEFGTLHTIFTCKCTSALCACPPS